MKQKSGGSLSIEAILYSKAHMYMQTELCFAVPKGLSKDG